MSHESNEFILLHSKFEKFGKFVVLKYNSMKMKRIFIYVVAMFFILCAQAQEARHYFTSMPDSVLPLLTAVNRADCIDFLDSHMRAEITNRFNTKSEMTKLTPDFIEMKLSSASTWQMKVLPRADAQVVCVVSTVSGPAEDSHIRFYSDDWKALPLSSFIDAWPQIGDFFTAVPDTVNANRYQSYRSRVEMLLTKAVLSPDAQTLTFIFTTPAALDAETAAFLKPYIREEVVYHWRDGQFVR